MMADTYRAVGRSVMTPIEQTKRKLLVVPRERTTYTLQYHYNDLDFTPVRGVSYRATLADDEIRTGLLDTTGQAQLAGAATGPVLVEYQYELGSQDDPDIVAKREAVRRSLDAIVAQVREEMAEEWRQWNEAGPVKRALLIEGNKALGAAKGAANWATSTAESLWQLLVVMYKVDAEIREIRVLFLTGQWRLLDQKIAAYRAKGDKVLGAASEVKEMLILIFHDEATRQILQEFPGNWWSAMPPDEQAGVAYGEIAEIAMDIAIAVIVAAFTAGAGAAAYGGAKWAARTGKLGVRLAGILEKLKGEFKALAEALKVRKRKTIHKAEADAKKLVETKWKPHVLRSQSIYSPPLRSRHSVRDVKQGGVKKAKNTVSEPHIDMNADVAAINRGEGTREGNLFTINGRTYELSNGDHLVPHSGSGFHNLSRGEFDALGIFNKFGDTPQAREIAQRVAGPDGVTRALEVWRLGQ